MGKENACGRRPLGYTGNHHIHLELSCAVIDAIWSSGDCKCKRILGGALSSKGSSDRYVDVSRVDGGKTIRLIINDLRQQHYFVLPAENTTTSALDLHGQVVGFLRIFCPKIGIALRVGKKKQNLNGSSNGLSESLVVQDIKKEEGCEKMEKACGHGLLMDVLLRQAQHGETNSEILELVDLFQAIQNTDEAKAIETFQTLKVHLDAVGKITSEGLESRQELETYISRLQDLEFEVLELTEKEVKYEALISQLRIEAKKNEAYRSLPVFVAFFERQVASPDKSEAITQCQQECTIATEQMAQVWQEIDQARAICAPYFGRMAEAVQAVDYQAMQVAMENLKSCGAARLDELKVEMAELQNTLGSIQEKMITQHDEQLEAERFSQLASEQLNKIQPAVLLIKDILSAGSVEKYWKELISQPSLLSVVAKNESEVKPSFSTNSTLEQLRPMLEGSRLFELYRVNRWNVNLRPCSAKKRAAHDPLNAYQIIDCIANTAEVDLEAKLCQLIARQKPGLAPTACRNIALAICSGMDEYCQDGVIDWDKLSAMMSYRKQALLESQGKQPRPQKKKEAKEVKQPVKKVKVKK